MPNEDRTDDDSIQHVKLDEEDGGNDDDTYHTSNNPTNANNNAKDVDQTSVDDNDADDEQKEEQQSAKRRRRGKYKRNIKSLPFDAKALLLSNTIEERVIIGNEVVEKEIIGMGDLCVGQAYPVAVAVTTVEPQYDPIVYLQDLNLQQLRDFARIVGVRNASKMNTFQCRFMIAAIVTQLKERRLNRGLTAGSDDDDEDEVYYGPQQQQRERGGEVQTDGEGGGPSDYDVDDEQKLRKMRSFINRKLLPKKLPARRWTIIYSTDRRYNTLIRLINILFSEQCKKRFVRYSPYIQRWSSDYNENNEDDENINIIQQFFDLISTHFFTVTLNEHEVIGKNKKKRKKYTRKDDTNVDDTAKVAAVATATAAVAAVPDTPGTELGGTDEAAAAAATDAADATAAGPPGGDPYLVLDCSEVPDPNGIVAQRLSTTTFSTADYFPLTGNVLLTWAKDFLIVRKQIKDTLRRELLAYDPENPTAVDIYPYVEQTMIALQKDRIMGVFPAYYFYIKSLACPDLDKLHNKYRVLDDVWNEAAQLSVSSMSGSGTDGEDGDDNEDGEADGGGAAADGKRKKKKQRRMDPANAAVMNDIHYIKIALHKFNKNQKRTLQIQSKLVTDQIRLAQLQQISSIVAIRNTLDSGKDPERYQKYTKAIEDLESKLFGDIL